MTIIALWNHVLASWRARQRDRRDRRDFERLDDRTLRDLGLHRGEFESLRLEAGRALPPTRRRLAGLTPR